jgi:tRNA (mo5U34)-methyltransferase
LEELRREVNGVKWFHEMDLGRGVVTPGVDSTPRKLKTLHLPESFAGRTVLDVGAWDGFFSFEAERRGAKRVLATDHHCWTGEGWGTKAGFDLAHRVFGSEVESLDIDVLDLSPDQIGIFDVVLFLGVLYHMRYPLLALERISSVTSGQLILETELDLSFLRRPAVSYFLEGNDWCAPNLAALRAMLHDVGFARVEVVYQTFLPHRLARACEWRLRKGRSFWRSLSRGRAAVHAWKKV